MAYIDKINVGGQEYDLQPMESVKDTDGHNRFASGSGEVIAPNFSSDATYEYVGWSLSGKHLMFVASGVITNANISANDTLLSYTIPQWIKDKIKAIYQSQTVVEIKAIKAWTNSVDNPTDFNVGLVKSATEGVMTIKTFNAISVASGTYKNYRIVFDLEIS